LIFLKRHLFLRNHLITSDGSGWDAASVSANLTGLTRNTTYHYRLVATTTAPEPVPEGRAISTALLLRCLG